MTDAIEQLDRTFAQTGRVVHGVRPDQLDQPTVCEEWDVRALLEHTIGVIARVTSALTGTEAVTPKAGDLEGLVAEYDHTVEDATAAWREPGAVERELDTPFGRSPGLRMARLNLADTLVHGWDLARATGQSTDDFDPELADAALAFMREMMKPEYRGPTSFGPEVEVGVDASVYDRLLAFSGRTP